MRKLVIAFAVVIMLGGATVAGLKSMKIGPFAEDDGQAAVAEVEEGEEGAAEVDEELWFVDMPLLAIPIFQDDKVLGTIQVELRLETSDYDNQQKLKRLRPRLTDAFLKDLYAYIPRRLRRQLPLDIPVIKARLRLISERTLKAGLVKDVLVQSLTEVGRD